MKLFEQPTQRLGALSWGSMTLPPLGALLVVALMPAVVLGSTPAVQAQEDARPSYRGWVGGFDERNRVRGQGNYHSLEFRVSPGQAIRYRVCISGGAGDVRRCFSRRTRASGRSSINVSLFVNDQGGPGRWQAVWHVRGRRVASWRFQLRPEGV